MFVYMCVSVCVFVFDTQLFIPYYYGCYVRLLYWPVEALVQAHCSLIQAHCSESMSSIHSDLVVGRKTWIESLFQVEIAVKDEGQGSCTGGSTGGPHRSLVVVSGLEAQRIHCWVNIYIIHCAFLVLTLYILTYFTYFDTRPVSVQAGPPSASGFPLRNHPELDEASHRHRVGL